MLERRSSGDRCRKHFDNPRRMSYKFARLLQYSEITIPSELQRFVSLEKRSSEADFSRNNKVRVILKINESKDTPSCLTINKNQHCVGLIDPTPSRKSHNSNNNINLFPFDSIFTESDKQNALLSNSITDPIIDLFKGKDSCILSFGNAGLGKTKTMIGSDQSMGEIGIIPCALAWVFKVLEHRKITHNTQYDIHLSALEIANKNVVRDLLLSSRESSSSSSSCSLLPEKINGVLSNQKKFPVSNLKEAARILDNVLSLRSADNGSLTHLQFIIHLHQYHLDGHKTDDAVSKSGLTGRSRLYFLDLGSGRHGTDDSSILSLQGMSKVILALFTSQRHIPYKDNVLTQLLKETLSVTSVTTMLVHISTKEQKYNETLQIVQLASKLYRTRSRKSRSVGFLVSDETSSCSSSSSGFHSRRLRPHMGVGAARRSSGNSSASSELDLTSASELSCCETVIFRGNKSISGSEKSLDQKSVNKMTGPESSESDIIISDKESSKDYVSSSNTLSPSVIRRRKISPRTNARAWPSSNHLLNITADNSPELWVDGPNAVYKSDQNPQEPLKEVNHVNPTSNCQESNSELIDSSIIKPIMMSKETQCDDVWDSSSSLTDGSSHSNTLDRKEHRPLSDISECTEDTESNLANDSDLVKLNILEEMCPINDFDDLLESTFGISPLHENVKSKTEYDTSSSLSKSTNQLLLIKDIKEKNEIIKKEQDFIAESQKTKFIRLSGNIVEKTIPTAKIIEKAKKHYHSATDSKRSSKSDQKERKSKSKCKKCTKSVDKPTTSLTSSNSTDFSRVASWIQKVEYEIKTSGNDNVEDDVFLDNTQSYICSQHSHHQSQPDISCHRNRSVGGGTLITNLPIECNWQPNNPWITTDFNHVRYSLYGSHHMQHIRSDIGHVQKQPLQTNITYGTKNTSAQHMSEYTSSSEVPPFNSPKVSRPSTISYTRHTIQICQPPLPPLPQQTSSRDSTIPPSHNVHTPPLSEAQNINSNSALLSCQQKCKTLPRDMYSDSSPLTNANDIIPSKTPFNEHSLTALYNIKSSEKVKKEPKNIISILFAPFISLRNKMNKGKCSIERRTASSETDIEQSIRRESANTKLVEKEWSLNNQDNGREFMLSSPYHLVTPPKTNILPTESSGHGSESSSISHKNVNKSISLEATKSHKCRNKSSGNNQRSSTRQRPTSSGYGSIIIKGDSEVSSHNDSSSDYSMSGQNQTKPLTSHSNMKHSISLSNCKSKLDIHTCANKIQGAQTSSDQTISSSNDNVRIKSISTAHDLILLEKLKIFLNEERKVVIEYIETNRLRGIPAEATIMNLICFKGVDNFQISNTQKREECRKLIEQIGIEIEQLKHKLIQAQHNLLLITTFDSNPGL